MAHESVGYKNSCETVEICRLWFTTMCWEMQMGASKRHDGTFNSDQNHPVLPGQANWTPKLNSVRNRSLVMSSAEVNQVNADKHHFTPNLELGNLLRGQSTSTTVAVSAAGVASTAAVCLLSA